MRAWSGPRSYGARRALAGVALVLAVVVVAATVSLLRHPHDQASRSRAVHTARLPLTFTTSAYAPRPLDADHLAYANTDLVPPIDRFTHDAHGVRMYARHGVLYDHPVAQAQYGLHSLETYRVRHKRLYLDKAVAQAQRLVDRRTVVGRAWFLSYPYVFPLHGRADEVQTPPWYSAMAQGQALSLFTRLYLTTGKRSWRDAADATFASFLLPPSTTSPWVVHVDGARYLWLDEFPHVLTGTADLTFNGHNFATFGLYDYAVLTHDPEALRLLAGAETTTRHYAENIRVPGGISHYCFEHPAVRSGKYHLIHTSQLLQLYAMTGDPWFARAADEFRDDYPDPHAGDSVRLDRGSVTGYTFDQAGHVTGSRSISSARSTVVPADSRSRIPGRGVYDHISSGRLAGYWVADGEGGATMRGILVPHDYAAARRVGIPAGTVTAYAFDDEGNLTGRRSLTFARPSSTSTVRTAVIASRTYVLVAAGVLAGEWIASDDVTLDG